MKNFSVVIISVLLLCQSLSAQQPGSGYSLIYNGGSNYVDVGKVNLGTSNFSAECWFKLTDVSAPRGIMGSWVASPLPWPAYFYFIYGFAGSNVLTVAFHTQGNQFNSTVNYTVNLLNEWHHVAATFNRNGNLILYFDGIARDSVNISAYNGATIDNPNVNVPLMIGAVGGGAGTPNAFFRGEIDEVRIWNKVLTSFEIRQQMCKRLSGLESNLKAYWRFDEGASTIINDSSPSGYTGTAY